MRQPDGQPGDSSAGSTPAKESDSMPNPIVHFEVIGKDKQAMEDFYTAIFDWQLTPVMDNYSMVSAGSGIGGGIGSTTDGEGHVTFYVEVEDVANSLSVVESRGGQVTMGPEQMPGGPIIGIFTDPEGHVVGLVQAGSMRTA
jgi:uncharacterized protein